MRDTLDKVKQLRPGDASIILEKQKKPYKNSKGQEMPDKAPTWHISRFIPVFDPATGAPAILAVESDVSQLEQRIAVESDVSRVTCHSLSRGSQSRVTCRE